MNRKLRLLALTLLAVCLATPAQASPTVDDGPETSQGVDWGPDHGIDCNVYPGTSYDTFVGYGRKARTNGTGECNATPDYAQSFLYLERLQGFGWITVATDFVLNPGTHWLQTATSTTCVAGYYRSRMKFYAVHGNPLWIEKTGPVSWVDCK